MAIHHSSSFKVELWYILLKYKVFCIIFIFWLIMNQLQISNVIAGTSWLDKFMTIISNETVS